MKTKDKTIEFTFERSIPATPAEVYDAWFDTKNPGNPWHDAERVIMKPKPNGLFYFMHVNDEREELPHFGRFVALERGKRIQKTWMSRHTQGLESVVTVALKMKGDGTLLTLRHSNLPDSRMGRLHNRGWNYFLGILVEHLTPKK